MCGNTVLHKVLGVGELHRQGSRPMKDPFWLSAHTLSSEKKRRGGEQEHMQQVQGTSIKNEVDAHDALQEMTLRPF